MRSMEEVETRLRFAAASVELRTADDRALGEISPVAAPGLATACKTVAIRVAGGLAAAVHRDPAHQRHRRLLRAEVRASPGGLWRWSDLAAASVRRRPESRRR